MLSLGTLTAVVGTVVDDNAATADLDRVADDLDAAVQPVEATGRHEGRVSFTDGEIRTTDRTLRLIRDGDVVATEPVDGLVYETGQYRILAVAGAIVRDHGGSASLYSDPPFSVSEGVVLVGAAVMSFDSHVSVSEPDATTVTIATDVSHDRRKLGEGADGGDGEYGIAVETDTPDAWERYFERIGADDVERRRYEGDDHESVVATFDGDRTGYFVVHELDLEVRR